MATEMVPIGTLIEDPANARRHPDRNLETIKGSLLRFGQQTPLVVDAKGVVRKGNGTLRAMRELRAGGHPDRFPEVEVKRTDLAGADLVAYAIVDNRSSEQAEWDQRVLAETLESLRAEPDFPVDVTGFDAAEVDALLDAAVGMSDAATSPDEGDDEGDETAPAPADGPRVFADEAIVESAFAHFRASGFPYRNLPVYICMQQVNKLAATDADKLRNTGMAYHVADTYHPHRWHGDGADGKSPFAAFHDDRVLRRALSLDLEHGPGIPNALPHHMVNASGTRHCSNFRPGFACLLYRRFCQPGMTVLDTSTGYGGRLVGFMASGVAGRYIGVDPNVPTHEGNARMAADLGFADRVELVNLPAEDVDPATLAGRCDFAFTSPPYFSKEHYSGDATQSWVRYKTLEAWVAGFLRPMMALQFAALVPGSTSIVNIADVIIGGDTLPLADLTVAAGRLAGFEHLRTEEFPMQRRFGEGNADEVATEPVLVFRRP